MIEFEAFSYHRQRQELSMQWTKNQQNSQLYFQPG